MAIGMLVFDADSRMTKMLVSAKAIRKLSEVLGDSLVPHHSALLDCLLKEVPGRVWEGKDAILYAISALCTSCHKAICIEDLAAPNAILDVVSSACSKKVKKYREAAFTCLQQVIKAFGNPDFFGKVFPLLYEVCNQASVKKPGHAPIANDAEKAGEDKEDVSAPYEKVIECISSCIDVAHFSDIFDQGKKLIDVYLFALSPGLPWTVKMSVFSSVKELCSKLHQIPYNSQDTSLHADASSLIHELFTCTSSKVVECISTIKIAQVHIGASECLLEMTKLYKARTPLQDKDIIFTGELVHLCEVEKNEQAKSSLRKCLDILEGLQPDSMQIE
ncbi:Arm repeat superfamily protein [Thalictrum thalictroides]|uniref:Arm repeat superfamily protein n=1 Tax=Thalictrum thalictroides TaxID=46969 RepID=A0A7J6UYT1_THATH|nr:Arm repeat superfamily protein [Thalictrum thalictroides]